MTYEIVPFNAKQFSANSRGEQSELMKSLISGGSSLKRISIRGKIFRLTVAGEEIAKNTQGYLDVIIVNSTPLKDVNRIYFGGAYDSKADAVPPLCWSDNGRVPNKEVAEPIAASCMECPMSVAGSGVSGKGKACKYQKRLAVILASDPDSGVYQLPLPSMSIFSDAVGQKMPYNAYVKYLASLNFSIDEVVTRLTFDEEEATPKVFMEPIGHPSPALLAAAKEHGASPEAKAAVIMGVYQVDKGVPVPSIAKLPEPAKVEEAPVAAKVAEPVVRPAKPKVEKVEVSKPDINAVLAKFANAPAPASPVIDDEEEYVE